MRFILLTLGILMAVPAYAADSNPVITINPDGSVTVVGDMPAPVMEAQPAPPLPDPEPAVAEIVSPVDPVAEPVEEANAVPPAKLLPPLPKAKPHYTPPVKQAKKSVRTPVLAAVNVEQDVPQKEEVAPPGSISREHARRIALAIAPPSRSVDVYPADYNGLKVFQVVFKTEDGEQYVLVDRQNGEIVTEKKGKRK